MGKEGGSFLAMRELVEERDRGEGGGGWVGLRWKRKVDIVKVLRWSSVGNTLYQ